MTLGALKNHVPLHYKDLVLFTYEAIQKTFDKNEFQCSSKNNFLKEKTFLDTSHETFPKTVFKCITIFSLKKILNIHIFHNYTFQVKQFQKINIKLLVLHYLLKLLFSHQYSQWVSLLFKLNPFLNKTIVEVKVATRAYLSHINA